MVASRYIYTNKVGAGPEHPNKRWGLFTTELTPTEAEARYALNAAQGHEWFGIVLLEDGQERPSSYLQMCPRANGVVLHKLGPHGRIDTSYHWRAYYSSPVRKPYSGNDERVFLSSIIWYAYPKEERFFNRGDSVGHVEMTFRPDGYAREDQVVDHGFNQPSDVETREFRDVDVSVNWFAIPEFGDWDAFFHPAPKD